MGRRAQAALLAAVLTLAAAGCGRVPSSAHAGASSSSSSSAAEVEASASSSSSAEAPPVAPAPAPSSASSSALSLPVSVSVGALVHGSVRGTPPPRLSGAVAFATVRDGLVGLDGGGVLATSDGGASWRPLDAGGPVFQALAYPAAGRAFGLTFDQVLMTSTDGGRTWTKVRVFVPSVPAFSVGLDFTGAATGWVSVGATLYVTADGGARWASHPAPCPTGQSAGPVDAAYGYVMCAGEPSAGAQAKTLFATSDGGATWVRVPVAASAAAVMQDGYASDLVFVSAAAGYLTEARGGLYRTDDGGRTFRQLLQSDGAAQMAWPSVSDGYLASNGDVLATADGGATWRQVYPALAPTESVVFTSADRGLGLAGRSVLATSDGGRSWAVVGRLPAAAMRLTLQPAGVVWAYYGGLYRSSDFGRSWAAVTAIPPADGGALEGLSFPSATVGFAEDNQGQMFRSEDGGRTWSALPRSGVPGGADLAFATPTVGWAFAGVVGAWETTDGGETWRPSVGWRPSPVLGGFADASRGWTVGVGCAARSCAGALLRTGDGGKTWESIGYPVPARQDDPSFVGCSSVDFPTASVGYAVLDGHLYRSADGGVTWTLAVEG